MYSYYVYGCYVQSDIPLYNMPCQEGIPEIFIKTASIERPENLQEGQDYYSEPKLTFFQTPFCRFLIRNGATILVDPFQEADMYLVTSLIIGYGFAFLFAQRGATAFHCTALSMYQKGVMISGISGAGKSTTAYQLVNRGHKYLVDDIAIMYPKEHFFITPAFPIQKICGKDIDAIPEDKLLYINETRDKYSYYNIEQFETTPREITTIFFITTGDVDEVIIEEQTGLNRFLRVLECQYLVEIFAKTGTPEVDKQNCLKLAGKIRFYKIIRPKNKNTLEQIADMIEKIMQE